MATWYLLTGSLLTASAYGSLGWRPEPAVFRQEEAILFILGRLPPLSLLLLFFFFFS